MPCPAPVRSTALGMVPGQLILVCDVGGGTTDFTVIVVRAGKGGPRFDRLAVGDHLMLGGDNMDLTIARSIETRLFGQPGKLDSKRWHQLCHQCRKAKETLLADPERRQIDVIVVGTGGKLIGDTLKETVTLEKVEELILEGFFPNVAMEDLPHGSRRTGLTEFGLPYVQDPAVTRHLAAFWQRHLNLLRDETGKTDPCPDYLLFNGGALTPEAIRTRIARVVQGWFHEVAGDSWAPRELHNPRPELAVAVGAAYYGLVKQGEGLRVGAGSPRAYYVEVTTGETPQGVPGEQTGRAAVCLAPRGVEEGFETLLQQPAFELITNQPVAFQLLSSSTRLGDRLGDLVVLTEEDTSRLPPIRTVLRYGKKGTARNIPVRLAIRLTEIGTLELWCQSLESPHRWQLQFDVRSPQEGNLPAGAALPAGETLDSRVIEEARERIRAVYRKGAATAVHPPDKLVKELTAVLEMSKEQWPAPLIRQLADALLDCQESRGLSPHHEARWFNLLGFCLRPGFGDAVDDWRLKEVWKLYPRGIQFPRQAQCRLEWWVFWRRVAGGLTAGQQWHIYQQLSPTLPGAEGKKGKATKSPKKLSPQEWFEVMMALANFERLPVETKVALGRLLLENIRNVKPKPQELWAISRLGARVPFYGPLDRVIPAKEVADWLESLCSSGLQPSAELGQAIVQLARRTGDRERDLPQQDLERALQWLERLSDAQRFIKPLRNVLARHRSTGTELDFWRIPPGGPGLILTLLINSSSAKISKCSSTE